MGTFLFDKIVFGPIFSRRLGNSLGLNLLPVNEKICSFNCVYCECGWTTSNYSNFVDLETFEIALTEKLIKMNSEGEFADAFTFAGNGEPTLHPEFDKIIDITIRLRNKYSPESKIAVLSNATTLQREEVFIALSKIEKNILKLDAGSEHTYNLINQSNTNIRLDEIVENLSRFEGNLIIQTLFMRAKFNTEVIDNTTEEEIKLLIEHLRKIHPQEMMIYPISRGTPLEDIEKISILELEEIKKKINSELPEIEISVFA